MGLSVIRTLCALLLAVLACGDSNMIAVNRQLYLEALAEAGMARVVIPAGVIRPEPQYLPAVSCYVAPPPDFKGWLLVSDGYDFFAPFCFVQLSPESEWWLTTLNVPPGWMAAWVVTY